MKVGSLDGTRVSYDVVGTGPPILLLHGFSHDRTIWTRTGWVERLQSVWGWSFGATRACHLAKNTIVVGTITAGTYFGRIFTSAYVEARLSEASDALQRARWSGLESWPAVEPNEVHGPLLVYTGTRDGNVVRKLQHQRASIEATGGKLHVLEGLNHIELLTANGPVSDVVMPFIRAAA